MTFQQISTIYLLPCLPTSKMQVCFLKIESYWAYCKLLCIWCWMLQPGLINSASIYLNHWQQLKLEQTWWTQGRIYSPPPLTLGVSSLGDVTGNLLTRMKSRPIHNYMQGSCDYREFGREKEKMEWYNHCKWRQRAHMGTQIISQIAMFLSHSALKHTKL